MSRIVEVTRGLGLGGAETLMFTRLRHWVGVGAIQGADILVVNTHSPANYYDAPLKSLGVEVRDLSTSSRWVSVPKLWRLVSEVGSDVSFVVHSPWPAAVLKLRAALRGDVQVIEVAHSTRYARPMMWLGRALNRYATACVAVSEEVAQADTTHGFRSKTVILAGADRDRMRAWIEHNPDAPAQYRAQIGITASARLVVAVGNLLPLKGHVLIVEALKELDPRVHLVIVGEGPSRPDIVAAARAVGCEDRVHLVGRQQEAWRWAAVADVIAHPSYYEGLPVALVEARVLGVPVVATKVGGVERVLRGLRDAVVVEPGNAHHLRRALERCLRTSPPAQAQFATRALEPSNWDLSRYCNDFLSAIQEYPTETF